MPESFSSYCQFVEKFVIPLSAKNPSWKTLNGDAGSSQAIAAKFLYDGTIWKVHEDARFDSLLAPYQATQGVGDPSAFVVAKTRLKTMKLKDGSSKVSGGNPKLVPKTGFGSEKHFYVYFDKKA